MSNATRLSRSLTVAALVGQVTACVLPSTGSLAAPAQCFESKRSIIYPLGDTASSTHTPADSVGAWLLLTNDFQGLHSPYLVARAFDVLGNAQQGSWLSRGDTVDIALSDLFTSHTLRLHLDKVGATGPAHGTTDERVSGANGVARPVEHDWVAQFDRVSCRQVPKQPTWPKSPSA